MSDDPSKPPSSVVTFTDETIASLTSHFSTSGYELRELLGRGGFSVVYTVNSSKYDRLFAAKITDISNPSGRLTCEREEFALQNLHHPNIVNLYESWIFEKYCIMILELCSRTSLKALIDEANGSPVPNCFNLMSQLCEAVSYLHSHRFAHRDIKPQNILLDPYGRAKLADFGFAVPCNKPDFHYDFVGTIRYLAPEVLRHIGYNPVKSDTWALGIVLYEMYKGFIVWPEGTNIGEVIALGGIFLPDPLPFKLHRLVLLMTRINPEQRPPVEEILASGEIQACIQQEHKAEPGPLEHPLKRQTSIQRSSTLGLGVRKIRNKAQMNELVVKPRTIGNPAILNRFGSSSCFKE